MSIKAISEIEEFLVRRDIGVSVAEIKERISEHVKKRENAGYLGRTTYGFNADRINFSIREGQLVKRDKLHEQG